MLKKKANFFCTSVGSDQESDPVMDKSIKST